MLKPRDYTDQENIIANCLDEYGLRYDQQVEFLNYSVDFYVPELNMVIEADGVYGHLKKADKIRDDNLLALEDINSVIHISSSTKTSVLEEFEHIFEES